MSLQLQLFLDYATTKASIDELDKVIQVASVAMKRQELEMEARLAQFWGELYKKWSTENALEEKFAISRNYNDGLVYYCLELERRYRLDIRNDEIEVTLNNAGYSKCRLFVSPDGTHEGCVRDGCENFDLITSNFDNIKYLLSFVAEVYRPLVTAELEMASKRLEYD